jgi:peptidoglycan hydrolase-like protein with peptidoglycan-binding domain
VRIFPTSLVFVLSAALLASSAFASRLHRAPTSGKTHGTHKAAHKKILKRGQQAIAPERVTEIQQALIREHYLDGEATSQWDSTTEAAMKKYQADQGWQTKLMPDPRAIKKLGLGPDYSDAINAKEGTFAEPPPVSTIPPAQSEGFAEAARVSQ